MNSLFDKQQIGIQSLANLWNFLTHTQTLNLKVK
jgi:hypothetical protein